VSQADDLPTEALQVLQLQLKPKWAKADHALLADLTLAWTDVVGGDRPAEHDARPSRR
jgi:hypothetical protein